MLTLQFVPFDDIENLASNSRINKLLNLVKEDKIVLMEGRLKPEEEVNLIQKTMEYVTKEFRGIELCTIYPETKKEQLLAKLKRGMANMLVGDRRGLTVIGPATIIKEIKRDPNKIQLLTENITRKRKRK